MRSSMLAAAMLACLPVLAQPNPAARPSRDVSVLSGRWNGAHLENRSNCATAGNNGFHGTYSEYNIHLDASNVLGIDEVAVTGLTCNYVGIHRRENGQTFWTGNHTCSDGRTGPFELRSVFALATLMQLRLSIQMQGGERCSVEAMLSGARF
jgi:hypothetical protein